MSDESETRERGARTEAGVADTMRADSGAPPSALVAARGSGVLPGGTVLEGTYRVKDLLGKGAMGAVYLVEHVALGKEFAVKIVSGSRSMDPAAVTRLRNEARMASAIEHENIVSVTHLGETNDGNVFVVMELLRGEDLRKRLERQLEKSARGEGDPWLSLGEVRAIAEPVLAALAAAHHAGIVHRDLKPDNVFLSQKRKRMIPKLVDFGIGKLRSPDAKDLRLTATGQIVGTPLYMAPEQTRSGSLVDHRADVYAVGVMIFEMLCGRVPFEANNFFEIVLKHATEAAPDPRSIRPDVPDELAAVVLKCLAKKPEDRWASVDELLEAWRAACGTIAEPAPAPPPVRIDTPVSASGPRGAVSTSAPQEVPVRPEPVSKAPIAIGAIGVVVLGIAALAIGGGFEREPAPAPAVPTASPAPAPAPVPPIEPPPAAIPEPPPAPEVAPSAPEPAAAATVRTVESDPSGADVIRDGRSIGRTPLEVTLAPGEALDLEVHHAGYLSQSIHLDASSRDDVTVHLHRRGATKQDPGAFPGLAPR